MIHSQAGRSLGFDLSGSLAAINQWVEDMDTCTEDDDGDVEDEDEEQGQGQGRGTDTEEGEGQTSRREAFRPLSVGAASNESYSHGKVEDVSDGGSYKSKHHQLQGNGLVGIQRPISKDDNETSSHGSSKMTSNSGRGSSTREILSRQKILSMVRFIIQCMLMTINKFRSRDELSIFM